MHLVFNMWMAHSVRIGAIKQNLMTKHNKDIDKLKSSDIKKILISVIKIFYRTNNKNRLQILLSITIKN